jgi:hypothetical protein
MSKTLIHKLPMKSKDFKNISKLSSHTITDQSKFSMKSFSPNALTGTQTPGPSGIRKSSNNTKLGTPQMFRSGSSTSTDSLMVQCQSHNQTAISDDLR